MFQSKEHQVNQQPNEFNIFRSAPREALPTIADKRPGLYREHNVEHQVFVSAV
jgi:hypothetical protein